MTDRPATGGRSVAIWFFAGTTLALGTLLAVLLWALLASGLIGPLGLFIASTVRPAGSVTAIGASPPPPPAAATPALPSVQPGSVSTPNPTVPPLTPAAPTVARSATATAQASGTTVGRVGTAIESDTWQFLLTSVDVAPAATGRRVAVTFSIKNNGSRAATLSIPRTREALPPRSPASRDASAAFQPVQFVEPPALTLRIEDANGSEYGGGFLSATGEENGNFTFLSAPGDAIDLAYVFPLPIAAIDPLVLKVRFGIGAGSISRTIPLLHGYRASPALRSSDAPDIRGREQRIEVGEIWSLTALSLTTASGPNRSKRVTLHLSAENRTTRPLVVGATLDDPTGQDRDFYIVDAAGVLAYSAGESMPRNVIPPRAVRTVDVPLEAPEAFANAGPYRVTVIVSPRYNLFARFRLD